MRTIAGAVVGAFVLLASSLDGGANAERVMMARVEAVMAAAPVRETQCATGAVTRDVNGDAGCAADDAPRDEAATPPAQQSTPAAKSSNGVCGRNPETGRRKCSVRYLA